jgi:hypothetical protein
LGIWSLENKVAGLGKGTVEHFVKSVRDVLLGLNKGHEQPHGGWGFDVDASARPAGPLVIRISRHPAGVSHARPLAQGVVFKADRCGAGSQEPGVGRLLQQPIQRIVAVSGGAARSVRCAGEIAAGIVIIAADLAEGIGYGGAATGGIVAVERASPHASVLALSWRASALRMIGYSLSLLRFSGYTMACRKKKNDVAKPITTDFA